MQEHDFFKAKVSSQRFESDHQAPHIRIGTSNAVRRSFTMMLTTVPEDARVAYLFANSERDLNAVTLEQAGNNLPADTGPWKYQRAFALGVQEVLPVNISAEPMLRGLKSCGYFIWPREHIEPFGTSQ